MQYTKWDYILYQGKGDLCQRWTKLHPRSWKEQLYLTSLILGLVTSIWAFSLIGFFQISLLICHLLMSSRCRETQSWVLTPTLRNFTQMTRKFHSITHQLINGTGHYLLKPFPSLQRARLHPKNTTSLHFSMWSGKLSSARLRPKFPSDAGWECTALAVCQGMLMVLGLSIASPISSLLKRRISPLTPSPGWVCKSSWWDDPKANNTKTVDEKCSTLVT